MLRSHFGSRPFGSSISGPSLSGITLNCIWYHFEFSHFELYHLGLYRLEWYGTEGIVYLLKVYTEKGAVGGRWGSEAGQAGQASKTR